MYNTIFSGYYFFFFKKIIYLFNLLSYLLTKKQKIKYFITISMLDLIYISFIL